MRFVDKMRSLYLEAKRQHADNPRLLAKQLLQHISEQLQLLAAEAEHLIEDAASGKQKPPDSVYRYIIKDRSGKELQSEYHDIDFVSRDDILASEGYKLLEDKISSLGVTLELQEEPCREYDDEKRVRYLILLSGWG